MPENSTLKCSAECLPAHDQPLQPRAATIERILQFAAAYRAVKTKDGHIMEVVLN